ncbi:exported protein [Enterobacter soli]|uniref:DUF2931 family protein n=1 Tax=Enterobacter soli TaxID=885040 RepID=UPI000223D3D9|nr:DUF2931 family protein [Enterobacter soli]AEN66418.1 exported protein [Enterobacter soli]OAT42720.1 hypothetical protein M987_00409 [Enterobacter soli ATCC BAA-2102]
MKRRFATVLAGLFLLSGCHAGEPATPEETGGMPYGKWDFAFFTPKALYAEVTQALIIDEKGVVYTFRTLDSVQDSAITVGAWNNEVRRHAQFNQARHPPVMMLFCWDSVIDKKTYETRIVFPASLKSRMLTPTGQDSYGTTWYDTLLIGLAPEGRVRIWLQNSGIGDNLPVEPQRLTTLSGDRLDACKGITHFSHGYRYTEDTVEFIKGKTYPYGEW